MGRKDQIIQLLSEYGPLTQNELGYHIFNDNNHSQAIYFALMSLVESNVVVKTGSYPAYFSLAGNTTPVIQSRSRRNNHRQTEETPCTGNVILLNKPFLGGWLNKQGNIGHEIIDFLHTDDGNYYVYNNPLGKCPSDIWVDGTEFQKKKSEKYLGKYLVLTSKESENNFDILYVIKLGAKLHRYHHSKTTATLRANQGAIKQIIREKNIKYNGKYLDEVYGNDDSLYVTFKGDCIYKARTPIKVTGLTYNFQRNKGYLYDDEFSTDYNIVLNKIEESIRNNDLEIFNLNSVSPEEIGNISFSKTFINLTKQEDNEQIFTNILHSILQQGDMFKKFCERFKGVKVFKSNESFTVLREVKVVNGRMDVCAESASQRVIIENKINSGLNGRRANDVTQLSTYYYWGREKQEEPLCFVVAPNHRCLEIQREIQEKDPQMENIYLIKTYGDIAEFISDEYNAGTIPTNYTYYSLIPQIIDAFKNLSFKKEEIYARMFLDATNQNA